jgi:hypothetical protein
VPYVVTVTPVDAEQLAALGQAKPIEDDSEAPGGWGEEQYAARDAVLARLGIALGRRHPEPTEHEEVS